MATLQLSNGTIPDSSPLKKSPSFRYGRKKSISQTVAPVDDVIHHLHGSDPFRFELNRLENQLRGFDKHQDQQTGVTGSPKLEQLVDAIRSFDRCDNVLMM